jgi:hypothetical protein
MVGGGYLPVPVSVERTTPPGFPVVVGFQQLARTIN